MPLRLLISLVMLTASVAFFWIDLPITIRAIKSEINYAVYSFFCFLIPISIVAMGWAYAKNWIRVLSIIIAVLVGLPVGFVGMVAFDEALRVRRLGKDPSLEFLKEVSVGDYRYRLYRTNCGATCAFGLRLQKERFIPIGLKFVRPIWSYYGAEDGELTLLDKEIQVKFEGDMVAKVPQ